MKRSGHLNKHRLLRFPGAVGVAGFFFLIISALIWPAAAAAASGSSFRDDAPGWKHFPGFDNEPVRIVDAGRFTYFLVAQKTYLTNRPTFTEPHLTLLRYDTVAPADGIRPLTDFVKLNGTNVRWAEYSPEGKFLTVVYADGGIDFVADSGKVVHNASFKGRLIPGWERTASLTVCGTEAWIASDAGFAAVEGSTGDVVADVSTGFPVAQAARSGSRVLLIVNGALLEADASRCRSAADLKALSLPSLQGAPMLLLPMGNDAFGMLTQTANSGTQNFCVASYGDGRWKVRDVRTFGIPRVGVPGSATEYSMVSHPLERNCIRNRDGYLIFVWTDLCQFDITGGPDAETLFRYASVTPSVSLAGSWDLSSGWTYRDRGLFVRGTNSWNRIDFGDKGEALRPAVPAVGHAGGIAYLPGHGMGAVNYGYSTYWTMNNRTAPALVSVYDGSRWSLPNGAYTEPAAVKDNEDLRQIYNANRWRYPVPDPGSLSPDPVFPDYVWLGSTYSGLAAINIADPSASPLHFSSPADPLAKFPGFKTIHPTYSWADFSAFTTPSFDADGTLWSLHMDYDAPLDGKPGTVLYYYTAANRRQMMESGDMSRAPDWPRLELPYKARMSATGMQLLALRHPANRHKLAVYLWLSPHVIGILDHAGTLPDASDDVYREVNAIRDQHGAVWRSPEVMCMAEDPVDGTLWIGTLLGLIGLDPSAETSMYTQPGKVLDIVDGDEIANPLAHVTVTGICFDSAHRMWVATENSGVWCVSADRKRIDAHYTAADSPLPSDLAYAIGFDPEHNAVMVSTEAGITVFNPVAGALSGSTAAVTVFPREITPGYAGNVVIHGLQPGARISIARGDEQICRALTADSDGTAVWNLLDEMGKEVPDGIYRIEGPGCRMELPVAR